MTNSKMVIIMVDMENILNELDVSVENKIRTNFSHMHALL